MVSQHTTSRYCVCHWAILKIKSNLEGQQMVFYYGLYLYSYAFWEFHFIQDIRCTGENISFIIIGRQGRGWAGSRRGYKGECKFAYDVLVLLQFSSSTCNGVGERRGPPPPGELRGLWGRGFNPHPCADKISTPTPVPLYHQGECYVLYLIMFYSNLVDY